MCDYRLSWSFSRWHWNVKTFCSRNANELFHTSPEIRVGSSVDCAAVWNSITFSNIFLFFRGFLKLIKYIILLLHQTSQRPFVCIGTGVLQKLLVDLESNFDNVILSVLHCLRTSLLQGITWLFSIRKRKWNYTSPPPLLYAWLCVMA